MKTRIRKHKYCHSNGEVTTWYYPEYRKWGLWWSISPFGLRLESAKRHIDTFLEEKSWKDQFIIYPEVQGAEESGSKSTS